MGTWACLKVHELHDLMQQAAVVPTVVYEHTHTYSHRKRTDALIDKHTAHMQELEESTAAHRQGRRR